MTFMVRPSDVRYPAPKAPALIDRVLAEIARVPGVQAASVDGCTPLATGCANTTLYIMGRDAARARTTRRACCDTTSVPITFARSTFRCFAAGSSTPAIERARRVSRSSIRPRRKRFWPNEDPIGQRVWFGGGSNFDRPDSSAEIVGIVGDVAYQQLDSRPFQPDFYTPYAQFTYATRFVLVRTARRSERDRSGAASCRARRRSGSRAVRRADDDRSHARELESAVVSDSIADDVRGRRARARGDGHFRCDHALDRRPASRDRRAHRARRDAEPDHRDRSAIAARVRR